jgi:hypothetical protein
MSAKCSPPRNRSERGAVAPVSLDASAAAVLRSAAPAKKVALSHDLAAAWRDRRPPRRSPPRQSENTAIVALYGGDYRKSDTNAARQDQHFPQG